MKTVGLITASHIREQVHNNVIVSDNATNQTIDYKGFVDNEMWIVIDDSAVMGSTYLTFYTDNPDTNPNAPIAEQVTLG